MFIGLTGTGAIDLVTGVPLVAQNGAVVTYTNRGRMINCQAANRGLQGTAAGMHLALGTTASILWAGSCPSPAPSSFTRLAGISYNSAGGSPYDFINMQVELFFGNYYPVLYFNDGASQRSTGNTSVKIDQNPNYCQAAAKLRSGNQTLWVNGTQIGYSSYSISSFAYGTSPQIIFGTYPGASFNTTCNMQNLCMWNRELTDTEFKDLWNYGPGLLLRKNTTKYVLFTSGSAIALGSTVESISEIKAATLSNSFSLNSKLESISELKATPLSKTFNFDTVQLESISEQQGLLLKTILLPSVYLQSQSEIKADVLKPKALSSTVESISEIITGISKFIGAVKLSATLKPIPPTSYTKGYPRPIAYLKNDNDNYGVTNETVESSPGDNDFS